MLRVLLLLFFTFPIFINAQIPSTEYYMLWEDNFEGQFLDTTKWIYRSLGERRDAINIAQNTTVQKGVLAIRVELVNDTIYSSMICTNNLFETIYGYFEIKAILPYQKGVWPAFWLQSSNYGTHISRPDLAGAEIDIMEFLPKHPKKIMHTVHYDGYKEHHKSESKSFKDNKFNANNWHTYGLEWMPDKYHFYIDGKKTATIEKGISQKKQYIILSMEVGKWAGKLNIKKLPAYFIVDYIKVYKKSK